MSKRNFRLFYYLAILAGLVWGAAQITVPRSALPARTGPALSAAKTWGYQLQGVAPLALRPEIDVLVVDYSRDGTDAKAWRREEVEALQTRAGGGRRIVLAYMSIGEAESYRFYWWTHWPVVGPVWLGPENAEWKGNYAVRYWNSDWQRLIVEPNPKLLSRLGEFHLTWLTPYLDRILEAGFDGVYLDRVDAFGEYESKRSSAAMEMVEFVRAISAHAKARKPGFLIVPQNGEELLAHASYRKAIDGIAKEDLLFGIGGDGVPNDPSEVAPTSKLLARARADGLAVFVVEYLDDAGKQAHVMAESRRLGFVPLFAGRGLSRPPALPPQPPEPRAAAPDATSGEDPAAADARPAAPIAPPAAKDPAAEAPAAPRAIVIEPLVPPAAKR